MQQLETEQGARLKNLINALNFKQESFARSLGMTQSNISLIVDGGD